MGLERLLQPVAVAVHTELSSLLNGGVAPPFVTSKKTEKLWREVVVP
jgi:hypothetical protein